MLGTQCTVLQADGALAAGWFDQARTAGRLSFLAVLVAAGLIAYAVPALIYGLAKRGAVPA